MGKRGLVFLLSLAMLGAVGWLVAGSQPTVKSIVFCKSVDKQAYQPIGKTTTFSVNDPAVYCFVNLYTPRDVRVKFEWYAPDGELYHTSNFGMLHGPSRPDGASGWYIYSSIDIAGTRAATMTGRWTVKVVLSPGADATKAFDLLGEVTPTPPGGVSPPPPPPSQEGGLLLSDDFSDPKSGWGSHSDPTGGYGYVAGTYYLENDRPEQTRWALAGRSFANFVLEVDTIADKVTRDESWGVVCRYQDSENFYLFEISADGYYAVNALVDGEWTTLSDWTESAAINTGVGARNHLQVTCDGARLVFTVNGQVLADLRDSTFSRGDIGFALSTYSATAGARILFDNLSVHRP